MREMAKKKNTPKKPKMKGKTMYEEVTTVQDDLFSKCIRKGLIEKTAYGYYFTPEFCETLEIYDNE
jgi:hypothetical protein